MSRAAAFWYGVFGAALPEVIRYMRLAATTKIDPPPSGWITYGAISIIYLVAAGIMSMAWKPGCCWSAIWESDSVNRHL